MNILIAPDAFKGSLNSSLACHTITNAIQQAALRAETSSFPMADGGEGTAEILCRHYQAEQVNCQVQGPLPQQIINANFGWVKDQQLAIMDAASACGLPLIPTEQCNPMICTSYGVGQLIQAAINKGAQRILLGVGGTATMDCGMGMLQALGWEIFDRNHQAITTGVQGLNNINIIRTPTIKLPQIDVLCDVTNPLLGQHGAARMFAKQKGASESDLDVIEHSYEHFNQWCHHQGHTDIAKLKYGGAAGGLASAAYIMLDASLYSGSSFLINSYQLEKYIQSCDLVISGEGTLDDQSLHGKVISAIATLCLKHKKPLCVFAGNVALDQKTLIKVGIQQACAINNPKLSLADNIANCQKHLNLAVRECAESLSNLSAC